MENETPTNILMNYMAIARIYDYHNGQLLFNIAKHINVNEESFYITYIVTEDFDLNKLEKYKKLKLQLCHLAADGSILKRFNFDCNLMAYNLEYCIVKEEDDNDYLLQVHVELQKCR